MVSQEPLFSLYSCGHGALFENSHEWLVSDSTPLGSTTSAGRCGRRVFSIMKATDATKGPAVKAVRRLAKDRSAAVRIHPVVIYPFRLNSGYADLTRLFDYLGGLAGQGESFVRPLTVIDRKTHFKMAGDEEYTRFRESVVARVSDIVDAWCVDTCQMWYTGLGVAHEKGKPGDIYWLIPGDFDYASPAGQDTLGRLHDLPAICEELGQDVCVGEIEVGVGHPKQLIDAHGTFALLYNWFPAEAREIRAYTERPRSEFFAVRHEFLGEMLQRRWYAYEQTMVVLLHAVFSGKRITRFSVGSLTDLPEGRESLASAIQQVERTERVLKSMWRERNGARAGWIEHYRKLEVGSESIRRSATTVLERLLG